MLAFYETLNELGCGRPAHPLNMETAHRKLIRNHQDLEVYRLAFDAAMQVFELTKTFPKEERYSLTDQIRRASRSVCANLTEAWRKRRYRGAFVLKLNDAESEAAETQTWLAFAVKCKYLDAEVGGKLHETYDHIIGKLVNMINYSSPWLMQGGGTDAQSR